MEVILTNLISLCKLGEAFSAVLKWAFEVISVLKVQLF